MIKLKLRKHLVYRWFSEDLFGEYSFRKNTLNKFTFKILKRVWKYTQHFKSRYYIRSIRFMRKVQGKNKHILPMLYLRSSRRGSLLRSNFKKKRKIFLFNKKNTYKTKVKSFLKRELIFKTERFVSNSKLTLKLPRKPKDAFSRFSFFNRQWAKKVSRLKYTNISRGVVAGILPRSKLKRRSNKKKIDRNSANLAKILKGLMRKKTLDKAGYFPPALRIKRKDKKFVRSVHTLRYFNLLPENIQTYKSFKVTRIFERLKGNYLSVYELQLSTVLIRSGFFENGYITNSIAKRSLFLVNGDIAPSGTTKLAQWDYISILNSLWWYVYSRLLSNISRYRNKAPNIRIPRHIIKYQRLGFKKPARGAQRYHVDRFNKFKTPDLKRKVRVKKIIKYKNLVITLANAIKNKRYITFKNLTKRKLHIKSKFLSKPIKSTKRAKLIKKPTKTLSKPKLDKLKRTTISSFTTRFLTARSRKTVGSKLKLMKKTPKSVFSYFLPNISLKHKRIKFFTRFNTSKNSLRALISFSKKNKNNINNESGVKFNTDLPVFSNIFKNKVIKFLFKKKWRTTNKIKRHKLRRKYLKSNNIQKYKLTYLKTLNDNKPVFYFKKFLKPQPRVENSNQKFFSKNRKRKYNKWFITFWAKASRSSQQFSRQHKIRKLQETKKAPISLSIFLNRKLFKLRKFKKNVMLYKFLFRRNIRRLRQIKANRTVNRNNFLSQPPTIFNQKFLFKKKKVRKSALKKITKKFILNGKKKSFMGSWKNNTNNFSIFGKKNYYLNTPKLKLSWSKPHNNAGSQHLQGTRKGWYGKPFRVFKPHLKPRAWQKQWKLKKKAFKKRTMLKLRYNKNILAFALRKKKSNFRKKTAVRAFDKTLSKRSAKRANIYSSINLPSSYMEVSYRLFSILIFQLPYKTSDVNLETSIRKVNYFTSNTSPRYRYLGLPFILGQKTKLS